MWWQVNLCKQINWRQKVWTIMTKGQMWQETTCGKGLNMTKDEMWSMIKCDKIQFCDEEIIILMILDVNNFLHLS